MMMCFQRWITLEERDSVWSRVLMNFLKWQANRIGWGEPHTTITAEVHVQLRYRLTNDEVARSFLARKQVS